MSALQNRFFCGTWWPVVSRHRREAWKAHVRGFYARGEQTRNRMSAYLGRGYKVPQSLYPRQPKAWRSWSKQ